MAKTLVTARHEHGPMINGQGGCFARHSNGGMCPGVERATWLNGLGEDDEFYIKPTQRCPEGTTNLQVRLNYIREAEASHIRAVNARLAELKGEEKLRSAQLRHVRKEIKKIEKELSNDQLSR